jgi:hypothetical protein
LKNFWLGYEKINPKLLVTSDKFDVFRRYGNPLESAKYTKFEDHERLNGKFLLDLKDDRIKLLDLLANGLSLVAKFNNADVLEVNLNDLAKKFSRFFRVNGKF